MNKVILIGRLTRDPELKFTPGQGTATTTVTLAVDKYNPTTKQNEADFISVVVWGKSAENLATYQTKGSLIAVFGRIQSRSYDAKDGTKRYVTEVVASEVQYLSKKSDGQAPGGAAPSGGFNAGGFDDDMTPVDDGDTPF